MNKSVQTSVGKTELEVQIGNNKITAQGWSVIVIVVCVAVLGGLYIEKRYGHVKKLIKKARKK